MLLAGEVIPAEAGGALRLGKQVRVRTAAFVFALAPFCCHVHTSMYHICIPCVAYLTFCSSPRFMLYLTNILYGARARVNVCVCVLLQPL